MDFLHLDGLCRFSGWGDLVLNGEHGKGKVVHLNDVFCVGFNEKWYVLEKRRVMIGIMVKMVQTHSLREKPIFCGARSCVEEIPEKDMSG